jgi:Zn-dependent protease
MQAQTAVKESFGNFIFATFILSIVLFFFTWSTTDFTLAAGISFFVVNCIFVFAISYFARAVQRWWARKKGYIAHYYNTWQGILITITISFFSFGVVPLLSPGNMQLEPNERLKFGKTHRSLEYKDNAQVALLAPLLYILIVIFLKMFFVSKDTSPLLYHLIVSCLLLAFFSMLPIPSFDGINIFAYSRALYVFMFVFVILYALLVMFASSFFILIPVLGAIGFTTYFIFKVESS